MGWLKLLNKFVKGSSSHKISEGQYPGKYGDDGIWNEQSSHLDAMSAVENEDLDLAIALSLSEEEQKKTNVVGKNLLNYVQITSHIMGWLKPLNKFVKGSSSQKISVGQYPGKYGDDGNEQSSHLDALSDVGNEDLDRGIALSLSEEEQKKTIVVDNGSHLEEDEQLSRGLQESLYESPPRENGQPILLPLSTGLRNREKKKKKGKGKKLLQALRLAGAARGWCSCLRLASMIEFFKCANYPSHKSCYKEHYHPKCDVCKQFIPTIASRLIDCREHHFWQKKYCPSHEVDGTPRCCSCERMEVGLKCMLNWLCLELLADLYVQQRDRRYVTLNDGRKLCLECLDSAIMDTSECQPLYLDIQKFYEGLNMKVEQQIPLLLVERQALNEALEGEKNGHHHMSETRGLCLFEEQTVSSISRKPIIDAGNRFVDMRTEPFKLTRRCEVTAILILYGLPRLLTGSILAHEMMHGWLRLKGYRSLSQEVEEGICQVLAHMWLDSEIISGSGSHVASTSTASSSSSSASTSKKGTRSQFEKTLGDFFKHQIQTDTSSAYGDGFRAGNKAMLQYGLDRTLDHIKLTRSFPC